MKEIITILIVGIVIPLLTPFISRYLELNIPDKKTMSSFIRKSLFFIAKYILVAIFLVIDLSRFSEVDKFVVLRFSIYFFVIIINIIIDVFYYLKRKMSKMDLEILRVMSDVADMSIQNRQDIKAVVGLQQSIVDLIKSKLS